VVGELKDKAKPDTDGVQIRINRILGKMWFFNIGLFLLSAFSFIVWWSVNGSKFQFSMDPNLGYTVVILSPFICFLLIVGLLVAAEKYVRSKRSSALNSAGQLAYRKRFERGPFRGAAVLFFVFGSGFVCFFSTELLLDWWIAQDNSRLIKNENLTAFYVSIISVFFTVLYYTGTFLYGAEKRWLNVTRYSLALGMIIPILVFQLARIFIIYQEEPLKITTMQILASMVVGIVPFISILIVNFFQKSKSHRTFGEGAQFCYPMQGYTDEVHQKLNYFGIKNEEDLLRIDDYQVIQWIIGENPPRTIQFMRLLSSLTV